MQCSESLKTEDRWQRTFQECLMSHFLNSQKVFLNLALPSNQGNFISVFVYLGFSIIVAFHLSLGLYYWGCLQKAILRGCQPDNLYSVAICFNSHLVSLPFNEFFDSKFLSSQLLSFPLQAFFSGVALSSPMALNTSHMLQDPLFISSLSRQSLSPEHRMNKGKMCLQLPPFFGIFLPTSLWFLFLFLISSLFMLKDNHQD